MSVCDVCHNQKNLRIIFLKSIVYPCSFYFIIINSKYCHNFIQERILLKTNWMGVFFRFHSLWKAVVNNSTQKGTKSPVRTNQMNVEKVNAIERIFTISPRLTSLSLYMTTIAISNNKLTAEVYLSWKNKSSYAKSSSFLIFNDKSRVFNRCSCSNMTL